MTEINIDSCRFCDDSIVVTIKELVNSGMSLLKASKEVAKAANSKIGHELYSPNSIRNRYQYYTGVKTAQNEQKTQQAENTEENENQTKSKGGRRRGAGRKPSPKLSKNHIVTKEFKKAFDSFYNAILNEVKNGFLGTRKDAIQDHLDELRKMLD